MKLTNLENTFTIFGMFAVFDEDTIAIINKLYSDCNISINQEPNNPNNKSGKVLKITDLKRHLNIIMRPTRIDVKLPGTADDNFSPVMKVASEVFNTLHQMFEGCNANRIAYVRSEFVFDEDGEVMQKLSNQIAFLPKNNPTTELTLRINVPEYIQDEAVNVVLNINNVMIGNNSEPSTKRRAIMITQDINTIVQNVDNRFELNCLMPYFEEMHNMTKDRLNYFESL